MDTQPKSTSDMWMSLSSATLPMDLLVAFVCGVGLFFLIIPFLRNHSMPPNVRTNERKVVRRKQRKTRKKNSTVKGWRDGSSMEKMQKPSQLQLIHRGIASVDTIAHPFWNIKAKAPQPPISQQLSFRMALREHIEQKCNQIFWGMSSFLGVSVVATAWVSNSSSSLQPKNGGLSKVCNVFPGQHQEQGSPQVPQFQPLLFRKTLASVSDAQTQAQLAFSSPNQTPSSPYLIQGPGIACPTSQQMVFPTDNQRRQKRLKWKKALTSNLKEHQKALRQPESHEESKSPALWKGLPPYLNISQGFSFLNPCTRLKLETDIKCKVRLRKGLHLQASEPVLPTLRKVPDSSVSHPPYPSSIACISRNDYHTKVSLLPEKLQEKDLEGKTLGSLPFARLQSPLPACTPSQLQEPKRETLSTSSHGLSEVQPVAQKGHFATPAYTYCIQKRTQHNKITVGTGRGSLAQPLIQEDHLITQSYTSCSQSRRQENRTIMGPERNNLQPTVTSAVTRNGPCEGYGSVVPKCSGTIMESKENSHPVMVKHAEQPVEVKWEEATAWKVNLGSSLRAEEQTTNINLRRPGSPGTSKSPSLSRTSVSQLSEHPGVKGQMGSEVGLPVNIKQLQEQITGTFAEYQSSKLANTESLPAQGFLPNCQKASNTIMGHCHSFMSGGHSQPKVTEAQIPGKNYTGTRYSNEEEPRFTGWKDREQGERLGLETPSDGSGSSLPNQVRELDTVVVKSSPTLSGKDQAPPKSFSNERIRNSLHYLKPINKIERQENSMQNVNSSPVQSEQLATRQMLIDSVMTEARSLLNIVVQILVDKLKLHVNGPPELQCNKVHPQNTLLGGSSHSQKGLTDQEQNRVREMGCGHHANPKCHDHPTQSRRNEHILPPAFGSQKDCDPKQTRVKNGIDSGHNTSSKPHEYPFQCRGNKDIRPPMFDAQETCDSEPTRTKRELDCACSTSPMFHQHPFQYRGIKDIQPPEFDTQRACETKPTRDKRGMDCASDTSPSFHEHPFQYRGNKDIQSPGFDVQEVLDSEQMKVRGMDCRYNTSPMFHEHPFQYRGIKDFQPPGFDTQRTFDSKQTRVKRGMGCASDTSPLLHEHPFQYRGNKDIQPPGFDAERNYDTKQTRVKRGYGHCASPKGHDHPFQYMGNKDIQQSCFESQRAHLPEQTRVRREMDCGNNTSPMVHDHAFQYVENKDIQPPGFEAQEAYDSEKSRITTGMNCGDDTSTKFHDYASQYMENKGIWPPGFETQRVCDQYETTVKRGTGCGCNTKPMVHDLPAQYMGNKNFKSPGFDAQRVCDQEQTRVQRGMGYEHHTSTKGHDHPIMYRVNRSA